MSEQPKRKYAKRKHTKPQGILLPDAVYNADGLMKAIGIGHASLDEARRSGIVKPRFAAGSALCIGREAIEWVETQPTTRSSKDK